jgi:hypothetical protein
LDKAFSATEVRHALQTLPDGTHIDQPETTTCYRDAQGRMREETADHVLIFDPVAGFVYNLDPHSKTYRKTRVLASNSTTIAAARSGTWIASTSSHPPSHGDVSVRYSHNGEAAAPVTEDLQPQIVNGIQAKGSRVTITIPKGAFGNDREVKVVNERWYSDDMQLLVKSTNSDPRFGVSTYELTNIVPGPSNPMLFQVPAEYASSGSTAAPADLVEGEPPPDRPVRPCLQ